MIKSVGIIGNGKMGKIMSEIFSESLDVAIYDIKNKNPKSLQKVCQQNLVLICIPTSAFKNALKSIKKLVSKNSVVMDVGSVKGTPTKLMLKMLPKKVQILGSHPMFGPNSLKSSKHIVLCPIRIRKETLSSIKSLFEKRGIKTVSMTPKAHDRLMARTQFLVHLFAWLSKSFDVRSEDFLPKSYKLMTRAFEIADTNDKFLKSITTKEAEKTSQLIKARLKTLTHELRAS